METNSGESTGWGFSLCLKARAMEKGRFGALERVDARAHCEKRKLRKKENGPLILRFGAPCGGVRWTEMMASSRASELWMSSDFDLWDPLFFHDVGLLHRRRLEPEQQFQRVTLGFFPDAAT